MRSFKGIITFFRFAYDKMIAFVVIVVLLISLLYLAVRAGQFRTDYHKFKVYTENVRPEYPEASKTDSSVYDQWLVKIEKPFQVSEGQWSNKMFVAEKRVKCWECKRPIPYHAEECPFCGTKPPAAATNLTIKTKDDTDGDGMPDEWEKKYGFDPFDVKDGVADKDNDLFSNIEEFKCQTIPVDATSHPPFEKYLYVDEIVADEFQLKFRSLIKMPGYIPSDEPSIRVTFLKFGLNLKRDDRTYFRKLGEDVLGFKLVKFEEKTIEQIVPGSTLPRSSDVSELTLQMGDKTIVLIKGREEKYKEYRANMIFKLDNSRHEVREKSVIELREGQKYEVLSIDSGAEFVLIRNLQNRAESKIEKSKGDIKKKASVIDFAVPAWK